MPNHISPNPLQARAETDDRPNSGPLAAAEQARSDNGLLPLSDNRWVFVDGDEIDGTRWNKSYPYQLLVIERLGTGYSKPLYTFTLPIPPQESNLAMPFAMVGSHTMGGYVEERNGAPSRAITFSGTTGVAPLKGGADGPPRATPAEGIFAGTVFAAEQTDLSVATLSGQGASTHNLLGDDEETLKGTGYYQFRLLQRFLESYAHMARLPGRENLRLAVAVWKDAAVYLVTPTDFTVRRTSQSPHEYSYTLQFRSFRRVTIGGDGPAAASAFKPVTRDPNAFAQLLNKLQEARRVLQASRDVLLAVQGDVEKVLFEPIREVTLFCKDALGVACTAADLPSSIATTLKTAVLEAQALGSLFKPGALARFNASLQDLGIRSGKSESGSGDTDAAAAALSGASEANKTFDQPEQNFELMEALRPSDLNLPPSIQRKIQDERERVQKMTRLDFEKTRDQFVEFQANFADAVGAGSTSYNRTYNRASVSANKVPTQDDHDVMFSLNQVILELNRLAASSEVDREQLSTIEAVAGMASASGIAFKVPVSKLAVPFPYGSTLEQLSAQYLGDANRWHEIVALNGLRHPYVDEEGFDAPLLTNGSGNQVVIGSKLNLFVGQSVWISSSGTARTKRRITAVDPIAAGTVLLTLDGDPDLDRFAVSSGATMHAFLPDTVNSQMLVYIPSATEPQEEDFRTKSIPGLDEFDQLLAAGGVDLLLTQNGDLAVTPDGDCRLAVGLTNLIQRVRTALGTPKGSLLHHPEYGFGLQPGISTADVNVRDTLAALKDMFRSDPAFSGVSGVAINKTGPALRISMSVGITGTNQNIPVTVDIRR